MADSTTSPAVTDHGRDRATQDHSPSWPGHLARGLFIALRSAEMLAEVAHDALRRGDVSARALAPYSRARRSAFSDKQWVTRALQFLIRRRRLYNWAADAIAPHPRLLNAMMGVIGDFVPPRELMRLSVIRALL